MSLQVRPAVRTWAGGLLVLLAHSLALWAWSQRQPAADPQPASVLIELHWLTPATPAPARPVAAPATKEQRGRRPQPLILAATEAAAAPAAEHAAKHPVQAAAAETGLESPSAAVAAQTPRRLMLSLAHEPSASSPQLPTLRDQVRQDPRAHSERRGLAWAVADAAGTLPVIIQTSTDGLSSTLIRQGSKCTRVSEARIATLNRIDEASKGMPAHSGRCIRD